MSKREEVLIKYKELLELVYEYCVKEEPFTCKHITRALKINDRAIIVMRKEGIITKLTKGRKKLYKWNYLSPPTSALVYDFYEAVNRDQQEWLLKQRSKKMDNQRTMIFVENEAPKQRRKISILWGLITF